jgi:hypothetical protein
MSQPGAPSDMCTLPNHSKVVGYLGGSRPPYQQDGDLLMPPGASYKIRITADLPVDQKITKSDLALFVWQPLYVPGRIARLIAFPAA